MNDQDTRSKLAELEDELSVVESQEKIARAACVICKKPGCEVISFLYRQPIHNKCHIKDLNNVISRI